MRDIKDRADQVSLKLTMFSALRTKPRRLGNTCGVVLTQVTADSRYLELEKELGAVLKDTLEGLEKT